LQIPHRGTSPEQRDERRTVANFLRVDRKLALFKEVVGGVLDQRERDRLPIA